MNVKETSVSPLVPGIQVLIILNSANVKILITFCMPIRLVCLIQSQDFILFQSQNSMVCTPVLLWVK
jgi:hypothetical protein